MKKFSFLKAAFTVTGTAVFLYGLLVISLVGFSSWFNFVPALLGAAVLAADFLWEKLKKIKPGFKIAAVILLLTVAVNFCIFEIRAIKASSAPPDDSAKYVMILGAGVHGSTPSFEFIKRIDAAAEYLKCHPDAIAVVTGGKGFLEDISESDAARSRLVSLGISDDRIIGESRSTSTEENMIFGKEAILGSGGRADDRLLVISSGFHLYRAEKLARNAGFTNVSSLGTTGLPVLLPYYYFREYAAYIFASLK